LTIDLVYVFIYFDGFAFSSIVDKVSQSAVPYSCHFV